jgi:hypothetical protein
MLLIFASNALLKVYYSSRWIWLKVYSFERSFLTAEELFGTDSDQNGMLEEIPRSGTDSYR